MIFTFKNWIRSSVSLFGGVMAVVLASGSVFADGSCHIDLPHQPGDIITQTVQGSTKASNLSNDSLLRAADFKLIVFENDISKDEFDLRDLQGSYAIEKEYPHLSIYDGGGSESNAPAAHIKNVEMHLKKLKADKKKYLKNLLNVCKLQKIPLCISGEEEARRDLLSHCTDKLKSGGVLQDEAEKICRSAQLQVSGPNLVNKNGKWSVSVSGKVKYLYTMNESHKVTCDGYKACENNLLENAPQDWVEKFSQVKKDANAFEALVGLEPGSCEVASLFDAPGSLVQMAAATRGEVGPGPQTATRITVRQKASSSGRPVQTAALVGADAFN